MSYMYVFLEGLSHSCYILVKFHAMGNKILTSFSATLMEFRLQIVTAAIAGRELRLRTRNRKYTFTRACSRFT